MDFEKLIMEDMKNLEEQQCDSNFERAIMVKESEHKPNTGEPGFSEQQLLQAGYLPKPDSLRMPEPLSHQKLRSDLKDLAVPVPRDYYGGDMHGEGKVEVYDSRGYDLFGDPTKALADIIKHCLPGAADRLPAKYLVSNSKSDHDPELEGDNSEYNELVPKEMINTNYGAIMKHPLARELKLEPDDMALTAKNEIEVEKLLTGNELTMVKPWSIGFGVLGANEDCVLLIDEPDRLSGQPGQLLAVFREDFFTDMPKAEQHYNPHTYTVQYDPEKSEKCQILVQQDLPFAPDECEMATEMIDHSCISH